MRLSLALTASALALMPEALAAVTTKSFVTCFTKYGPKSQSPVKTASAILTIPFYGFTITTTTPRATITPKAVTTTVSTTVTATTTTTLPQETDTFSSTSTAFATTTLVVTFSDSTTVTEFTTTTTTPTSTIAASAGFTPIKSSIPNSMKRRNGAAIEAPIAAPLEERGQPKGKISFKDGKPVFSPAAYPTAVTCAGIAKVITYNTKTVTAKTKTVMAAIPTSSVTTTFSTTITQTVSSVRASTTLSFSTTLTNTVTTTVSTTSTSTATNTVEVSAPAATLYAACDSDNFITTINGQPFTNANYDDTFTATTTNTAYDCCVACINTPNCGGSFFAPSFDGMTGFCALQQQAEAVCSQSNTGFRYFNDGASSVNAVASNGYCGHGEIGSF